MWKMSMDSRNVIILCLTPICLLITGFCHSIRLRTRNYAVQKFFGKMFQHVTGFGGKLSVENAFSLTSSWQLAGEMDCERDLLDWTVSSCYHIRERESVGWKSSQYEFMATCGVAEDRKLIDCASVSRLQKCRWWKINKKDEIFCIQGLSDDWNVQFSVARRLFKACRFRGNKKSVRLHKVGRR